MTRRKLSMKSFISGISVDESDTLSSFLHGFKVFPSLSLPLSILSRAFCRHFARIAGCPFPVTYPGYSASLEGKFPRHSRPSSPSDRQIDGRKNDYDEIGVNFK